MVAIPFADRFIIADWDHRWILSRILLVSIRLVMGASVNSIFGLLTSNFMKLVIISWVIGTPIAWYGMNEWLNEFTYREPISSFVLIAAGFIAVMIALITVSYQSIKAAMSKPVENLRRD